jgi:formate hydrogenlyase subunit 6/NADH:ubiquinone oxidoreductase subunit I
MNLFDLLVGRRQFMIGLGSSAAVIGARKVMKALDFMMTPDLAKAAKSGAPATNLKGCVIYYSATGSTRKAGQAIHRGLSSIIDCDIFPIKKADARKMDQYDIVAMGGPIWYNRETINIDKFIYEMPRMNGKFFVPFCTHGVGPNGFMYNITRASRNMGFVTLGWRDWYGSVFHVLHQPKPYFTDGHPDKVDLADAEVFGREMAERALRIHGGETGLLPDIPEGPDADTLWKPVKMERPENMAAMMGAMAGGDGSEMPAGEGGPDGGPGGPQGSMPEGGQGPGGQAPPQGGMPEGGPGQGPGGQSPPEGARGGGDAAGTGERPGMGMSTMGTGYYPKIDLTQCVYPRCRLCMDVCVQGAIDLASLTVPGSLLDQAEIQISSGCIQCKYPECQRACSYDAIIYKSATTQHVIDMSKCTYPKCTLCIDECLMESIYEKDGKLVFHNNCEGCDVCYCICPTGAVSIVNLEDTVHFGAGDEESAEHPASGDMPAGQGAEQGGGAAEERPAMGIEQEAPEGEDPVVTMKRSTSMGRFRSLVPAEGIGKYYSAVLKVKHRPILVLKEDDWPEIKDVNGNIINNYYD